MKVALLITTYNRPEYLRDCLWSLERADLSRIEWIWINDDASTNQETKNLIDAFTKIYPDKCVVYNMQVNSGIKDSLLNGYEQLFANGFDLVINLDSDAIVRTDFVDFLTYNYKSGKIFTGFNCVTKNANGTDRHKIVEETDYFYYKKSVGGINMVIDKEAYESFVEPALLSPGNWDHNACITHEKQYGYGAYTLKESVIQHIGFDSSMGHHEQPDIADDFYYWNLPDVTLIGVDSNKERLEIAKQKCTKWIKFGAVMTLNLPIRSKEEYSAFCIRELFKNVYTSHALIFQHDGFVHNWKAWDNDWLQYDYIGAPWHYNDGMAVGNGGFSLRSRRLMEIVANDQHITMLHPEDHHICRTYRPYLEKTYGIKFAPAEVAEKFSFEGYRQPNKVLKDQFGVHGSRPRTKVQPANNQRLIFNQFLSLGDILFLVPMARALMEEGNSVLWPIDPLYLPIAKHFPDVNFVNKNDYVLPYDSRNRVLTEHGWLLPYRFASENMGRTLKDCMRSKYELYGHDYRMWRELVWQRDYDAEKALKILVEAKGKYNLVNRFYGHLAKDQITPEITNDYPVIEMSNISGFTLIDWLGVIEGATELHIANSSLNYLIELMHLDIPVHLYKRNMWGEQEFEYSDYLFTNTCFKFHR